MYAQRYLADVAGMVLLDAAHPDKWQRELGLLLVQVLNEPATIMAMRRTITAEWEDPTTNGEGLYIAGRCGVRRALQ